MNCDIKFQHRCFSCSVNNFKSKNKRNWLYAGLLETIFPLSNEKYKCDCPDTADRGASCSLLFPLHCWLLGRLWATAGENVTGYNAGFHSRFEFRFLHFGTLQIHAMPLPGKYKSLCCSGNTLTSAPRARNHSAPPTHREVNNVLNYWYKQCTVVYFVVLDLFVLQSLLF